MKKINELFEKYMGELLILALVIMLMIISSGCGMLPSFGAAPEVVTTVPPSVPTTLPVLTDTVWRFGWLSLLLILFLPGVRAPLLSFWTAIFNALAIPFLALRRWYDSK